MTLRKKCQKIDSVLLENGFLDTFDHVLVDFNGVLVMNLKVIPGAPETLTALQKMGKKILYVTNNCFRDRENFSTMLRSYGDFPVSLDCVFCPSYCVAAYLQSLNFKKKVYIIGEEGVAKELDRFGISWLPIGPDPVLEDWIKYVSELNLDPEVGAVVVGFDPYVSFPKLIKAVSYLKNPECLFVAGNSEAIFLSAEEGFITPGPGSLLAIVEKASGRTATVMGKPNKFMFDCIKTKNPEICPGRCLMIGDTLDKDVIYGVKHGLKTLLVLTGNSKLNEVRECEQSTDDEKQTMVPDYYIDSLGDLGKLMGVC